MSKILVIGSGGREHALAWKLASATHVQKVYVAPGNAGTALEPGVENVELDQLDFEALTNFVRAEDISLTVVGPEVPLVAGVVDHFQKEGLRCFGPTAGAAQLEGSKAFSKDFLVRHHIPTAQHATFTDLNAALEYVASVAIPVVVKADGLAAGKGVIIAQSRDAASSAVRDMLAGNRFGEAGSRVVIEDFLEGEEASFIVMADGEHILPLATSQDHKARDDGDLGPNTGGMGAYSPAPVVTPEIHARVMREVIEPTIRGLAAEGHRYTGFLYAGLMIAPDGTPRVLEFNCRFGDPETQPILMRLQSDLDALCNAALDGRLHEIEAHWDPRTALGVVLAAGGYPDDYRKGDEIHGLPKATPDGRVFHAGTRLEQDRVVTNGGRVLCVTALGKNARSAQANAYAMARGIHWPDAYCRTDIGYRAIAREANS